VKPLFIPLIIKNRFEPDQAGRHSIEVIHICHDPIKEISLKKANPSLNLNSNHGVDKLILKLWIKYITKLSTI